MRRLIDDTSLKNECNKIAFGKCYKNDEGVNAIIKISTEIRSSANQTKQMIFDNIT